MPDSTRSPWKSSVRVAESEIWKLLLMENGTASGVNSASIGSKPSTAHQDNGRIQWRFLRRWESVKGVNWVFHLVPTRTRPRVFVNSRGWRWAGELFRPSSFWRRVMWTAIAATGRLGLANCVFPRLAVVTGDDVPLITDCFFKGEIDSLSLLKGSEGKEQKVVAQVVSGHRVVGYVKMSDDEVGRRLLQNERLMLLSLPESPRPLGPAILGYLEGGERTYLLTESVSGWRSPNRISNAHLRFLTALMGGRSVPFAKTGLFKRLEIAAAMSMPLERLWTQVRPLCHGVVFEAAAVHGDFAPWNLRETERGLRAIDWEYGLLNGIAGIDSVHFIANSGLCLRRKSPGDMIRMFRGIIEGPTVSHLFGFDCPAYQRRIVIALTMLFDVANGIVATGATMSRLNEDKLEITRALICR